jgi:hypothetical protein
MDFESVNRLASWILVCSKQRIALHHSVIDAITMNYFLPAKPDFPEGGSEFQCPNCGRTATHKRTDPKYRA